MRGVRAANRIRRVVIDYDPIDHADRARMGAVDDLYARVASGHTTTMLIDRGGPDATFGGYVKGMPQNLIGLAGLSGNRVTYKETASQLDRPTKTTDELFDDPAQRIFADRMRRRR